MSKYIALTGCYFKKPYPNIFYIKNTKLAKIKQNNKNISLTLAKPKKIK